MSIAKDVSITDTWVPAPQDLSEQIGMAARLPDEAGWRTGRIRRDGRTLALDNGSVVEIEGGLELLDLAGLGSYDRWLRSKAAVAGDATNSRQLDRSRLHESLYPHQVDSVIWAHGKKRAALFLSFGLGKTRIQLELLRLVAEDGPVLQVCPLGVQGEFISEAAEIGIEINRIRETDQMLPGINLTHYEAVREGKVNPRRFVASSLDEAACLRSMGASKTFREFMLLFEGLEHKFVATATPSPNRLTEIMAYAAYLEVADVAEIKTRFFNRNSEKADDLTLIPERAEAFYIWLSSWALFIEKPSDLGHDDTGYDLPPITIRWHEVDSPDNYVAIERNGQHLIGAEMETSIGLENAALLKQKTLPQRMNRALELLEESPDENFLIWHDLERERMALENEVPGIVTICGTEPIEDREAKIKRLKSGQDRVFGLKPQMYGAGLNAQHHYNRAIFLGVGFKAYDVLQAVRREHRFGQKHPVIVDLIYSRAELAIKNRLEEKWKEDVRLRAKMCEIVREFGLSDRAMSESLQRARTTDRQEQTNERWGSGETGGWRWINNDAVRELEAWPDNTADLLFSSPPFAGMYQYASHVSDMSFCDDNDHFWQGMRFLIEQEFRVLKPGRIRVVHAKDRIIPGNLSGLGFGTVYPFSDACVREWERAGFRFMARVTISTDPVRENNGTYRLSVGQKMADATKIGHGLPEYLLIFRKPQTSTEDGFADEPVAREMEVIGEKKLPKWLATWQVDANGFWRSGGNRFPTPSELATQTVKAAHSMAYQRWRDDCETSGYDYHGHIQLLEEVLEVGRLPTDFCLFPPHALKNDPNVWTRIMRARTLNMIQSQKGKEQHLCPMQFDIAERVIDLWSSPGDLVLDPTAGIGTVPLYAAKLGRRGVGIELKPGYWHDGLCHLEAEDQKARQMTLFDLKLAP